MIKPEIIFQNSSILVVQKPACILSVPARDHDDQRRVLGRELEEYLGAKVYPIHRLDFEVAGPMIYALASEPHREFCQAFESHAIKKTYQALGMVELETAKTNPMVRGKEGMWTSKLVRGKRRTFEAPHGKESYTLAKLIEQRETNFGIINLMELGPRTGRPHQLRYEMMKHGMPIVGDLLYGSSLAYGDLGDGIALCATRLELSAPLVEKWKVPALFTGPGPLWDYIKKSMPM